MFRSPWELEAHVRYKLAHLASERQRCAQIERADAGWQRWLTQARRGIGIGLIQVGTTIAGSDALGSPPTPPAWPVFARR